jgi:hypothetical protein
MRKKYFIVTFGSQDRYNGFYTKVSGQTISEARDKLLEIIPYYEMICSSMANAQVKEHDLTFIPFEQIKKEVGEIEKFEA